MILSENQLDGIVAPLRNGIVHRLWHWPNKTIPYAMNESHSREQQEYIEETLRKMEAVSCIKFVPRTNEDHYIQITVSKV